MTDKELSRTSNSLREIVWIFGSRGVNGECCGDLSMADFLALEQITNTPDCMVKGIGKRLGFTKSGATRIVDRLEKKGYVKRLRFQEDGRVCCIASTEEGKYVLESAQNGYSERLEELLSQMSSETAKQVVNSLVTMANVLRE